MIHAESPQCAIPQTLQGAHVTDPRLKTRENPLPLRGCTGRIGVFRALHLGDMLCAVPALRALRTACPDARITVIGLPWARELIARYRHYVDDFLAFPGHPELPETDVGYAAYGRFREAFPKDFDWLIQLHGDGRVTNAIVGQWPAQHMAGFARGGGGCHRYFLPYPSGHEIDRLLALVRYLAGDGPVDLEFPLHAEDFTRLQGTAPFSDLFDAPYVIVHPGSRNPQRRLAPAFFAQAVAWLASKARVVLTGGREERDRNAHIAQNTTRAINAAGMTSLVDLGVLIARARCIVTNDSGPAHLAAALGTPSLVAVSASDPARWAPKNTLRHRVLDARGGLASARFLRMVQDLYEDTGRAVC
ncbi:LPS biosynthesis glycosyltransferase [Acidiferrobacter thiooxydans]|uniref:LPS biosynthesis glycosyltransferase n=1 Tax=Acidiferrobacter thiooxydans TaxID=163359 RepID=A0A368HCK5_9GAMM|nr:LPS biosynthesis glycosyltransferase [Acidiferrobacter thiooxydans]